MTRVERGLRPLSAQDINREIYFLLFMMRAPITPGTQPQSVSRKMIRTDPQPLSTTARGGKKIQRSTRNMPMVICDLLRPSRAPGMPS